MKILVTIDGSNVSQGAMEYALDNFAKGDDVTAVHVAVPELEWGGFYESSESAAERGDAILALAQELAEEHGAPIQTDLLEGEDDPALAIVNYAKEKNFDMIVVGHRGTTERRRELIGSVAQEIVERADTSVLVVRPRAKAASKTR